MTSPLYLRTIAGLLCAGLAAGCSDLRLPEGGSGLAFSGTAVRQPQEQAGFARGSVVLVPPKGFCIDQSGIRRTGSEGFAMMARCDALGVRGFFGNRSPAVITAAIGAQPDGARVPTAADLSRIAGEAHVQEVRTDLLLPLVRLQGAEGALPGAAAVHWRGALVLDGHILSLALYAPEGSPGLDSQGAMLLNDLARRTLEASAVQAAGTEAAPARPAAPEPARSGQLRPRTRPQPQGAPEQQDGWLRRLTSTLF